MHEFVNYSDDEKEEFITGAKLLDHEWQIGDWAACKNAHGWTAVLVVGFEPAIDDIYPEGNLRIISPNIKRHDHPNHVSNLSKGATRLPTADDMLKPVFMERDWSLVWDEVWTIENSWHDEIASAPFPCLAMMRAIQHDQEVSL